MDEPSLSEDKPGASSPVLPTVVYGTRSDAPATPAGRDEQSGPAGGHPKSSESTCAGALPLANIPRTETKCQFTLNKIRSNDEEGASTKPVCLGQVYEPLTPCLPGW